MSAKPPPTKRAKAEGSTVSAGERGGGLRRPTYSLPYEVTYSAVSGEARDGILKLLSQIFLGEGSSKSRSADLLRVNFRVGVNQVVRHLEKTRGKDVVAVAFSTGITPKLISEHIVALASQAGVPACPMDASSEEIARSFPDFRSVSAFALVSSNDDLSSLTSLLVSSKSTVRIPWLDKKTT